VPGLGKALACVVGAGVIACGLAFAAKVHSTAAMHDRKWLLIGAGIGGAAFGAGVYQLWRTESRWRVAVGYHLEQSSNNRLNEVEYLLDPDSGVLYRPDLKRLTAVKILAASPLIMVRKVGGDVLALLGSIVGLRDHFLSDLDRVARDVVYAVAYPLGLLVTTVFPRMGQAFVAGLVRWANQYKTPAEITRSIPLERFSDECTPEQVALYSIYVTPTLPQCFQPIDNLDHPVDHAGHHKDLQAVLTERVSVFLTQPMLAAEIIARGGFNCGVTYRQLLEALTVDPTERTKERVHAAVATFWGMLDVRGRQQLQLNLLSQGFYAEHGMILEEVDQ
jgi:hypothetical protein